MRADRIVPTVPREGLTEIYTRARRQRAVVVHDLFVRAIHKLTPRLQLRRLGEHWG